LPSSQRTSLERLLGDPPTTSRKPLLCETIHSRYEYRQNTRLSQDGERLQNDVGPPNDTPPAAQDGLRSICTGSSNSTTHVSNSLSERGSRSTRSYTVGSSKTSVGTGEEAASHQLWLLFGVHGPRRLLEWDEIDQDDLSSDHLLIRKLRRRHSEMRGWPRLCFSVWQVRYWSFVKVRLVL
jgi:hypothetical protein